MNILQKLCVLFLIPILNMAGAAQGHEVGYSILVFRPTHSPTIDVVDVNSSGVAYFTGDIVFYSVSEVLHVYFSILFHLTVV
jgi:hypothetical protein